LPGHRQFRTMGLGVSPQGLDPVVVLIIVGMCHGLLSFG